MATLTYYYHTAPFTGEKENFEKPEKSPLNIGHINLEFPWPMGIRALFLSYCTKIHVFLGQMNSFAILNSYAKYLSNANYI